MKEVLSFHLTEDAVEQYIELDGQFVEQIDMSIKGGPTYNLKNVFITLCAGCGEVRCFSKELAGLVDSLPEVTAEMLTDESKIKCACGHPLHHTDPEKPALVTCENAACKNYRTQMIYEAD